MTTSSTRKEALLLNFKVDTLTSVSRTTLRRIAKALGFSETREEDASYPPLTKAQLAAIRKHEPKRKGRVLSSLLR
jgi:signal recognition particle subunit SEC65